MINSKIKEVAAINFPKFKQGHLYMHPINLENPILPDEYYQYKDALNKMLSNSPVKKGIAYVTIDNKLVTKGNSHRRGGPHVDGNFLFGWGTGGGNGWLTGHAGRILSKEKHEEQYCSNLGGTLISSSYAACKAWRGEFKEQPKQGGNCEHIKLDKGIILESNKVYLMNSTCIHESLPVKENVERSLIRITLPNTFQL